MTKAVAVPGGGASEAEVAALSCGDLAARVLTGVSCGFV